MRLSRLLLAAALVAPLPSLTRAQTTHTLLATPSTVAWGYYSAHAKPVLTVNSGDTVIMQTASTCGPPERLLAEGYLCFALPVGLDMGNLGYRRIVSDRNARAHHS